MLLPLVFCFFKNKITLGTLIWNQIRKLILQLLDRYLFNVTGCFSQNALFHIMQNVNEADREYFLSHLFFPTYSRKVSALYLLIWRWKWTKPLGILPTPAAYSLITGCKNSFSNLQRWMFWSHNFWGSLPLGHLVFYEPYRIQLIIIPCQSALSLPVLTRTKILNHVPYHFS